MKKQVLVSVDRGETRVALLEATGTVGARKSSTSSTRRRRKPSNPAAGYQVAELYLERRGALRPAHFAYANAAIERGELVLGGALADPPDKAVLLFRGDSKDAAEQFAPVLLKPYRQPLGSD